MRMVCQLCGEFQIYKGKRVDMTIESYPGLISHIVQLHTKNQQISLRLVGREETDLRGE